MDLHPDLIDLLTELQNSGAEYLIVGGWAVGIHAEPRDTKDLADLRLLDRFAAKPR